MPQNPIILELLKGATSGAARRRSSSLPQRLPSITALICWALVVTILLFMVSGCGRYKEELETTKGQVDKLGSEVKRLTEQADRLNQEKNRISGDLQIITEKNLRMQQELERLKGTNATLSAENKEVRQKNNAAEREIASLKREKTDLTLLLEELKKHVVDVVPPKTRAAMQTQVGSRTPKQQEELSPCDAVVAFMRVGSNIVKNQKRAERMKLLEEIKQQYAPKMYGAPEKAIKAAEDYVQERIILWDKSRDDTVFRLLQLRKTVGEACGKSQDELDF